MFYLNSELFYFHKFWPSYRYYLVRYSFHFCCFEFLSNLTFSSRVPFTKISYSINICKLSCLNFCFMKKFGKIFAEAFYIDVTLPNTKTTLKVKNMSDMKRMWKDMSNLLQKQTLLLIHFDFMCILGSSNILKLWKKKMFFESKSIKLQLTAT